MGFTGGASTGAQAPASQSTVAASAAATALPGGFVQEVVAAGANVPTAFTFLPDGRILIAEKAGTVRLYKNGALLPTPFLDLQDRVNDYWDHGLRGIAADPNFAQNGYVYVLYTYENDAGDYSGTKTQRLTRVTASGDTAPSGSEVVILGTMVGRSCNDFPAGADCLPADAPVHEGGNIKFAADGTMFVSLGDAAHYNFVNDNALRAQNLDSLAGKILHVTATGAGLSTNPFWNGNAEASRSKVWAYGVRNPWRFTLRPGSGLPYIGDVGWSTWDEIDVGVAGANLGWPCYEGDDRQSGYEPLAVCQALYARGTGAVRSPLVAYNGGGVGTNGGMSVTGGVFYTGTTYPAQYQGAYFYGDYVQGFMRSLRVDAGDNLTEGPSDFATGADGPLDIDLGPDQNLYYLAINTGELRRIRYAGSGVVNCLTGEYLAEYYPNATLSGAPTFRRCETRIDNDWGDGGPGGGLGNDNFSVRWTGRHTFVAGDYTFTARSDDGIRL
ncbi:MAG: PQQ-dependent sugar dehydrogenase [Chloroflexota bacterium]|nr:PQQ-dependent sugar dehydrogenase [Chloroflexota bacterium]